MDGPNHYLFHHIFLPRKLPHASDDTNTTGARALIVHLIDCVRAFIDLNDRETRPTWCKIERTLDAFAKLHNNEGGLSKEQLQGCLVQLAEGETVILHIALQNSGLTLRREGGSFLIESFETAAPAHQVLAATDALQWDFPSQAVFIDSKIFLQPDFLSSFADFLQKASVENVKQFLATTKKAGDDVYESRDVPAPFLVGQLLVAILEANGTKCTIEPTRKRVRDEVCWDRAKNPWRRSSAWLTLRVGIQRSLCSSLGEALSTLHYKLFASFQLAVLSEGFVRSSLPSDLVAFARARVGRRAAKLQHRIENFSTKLNARDGKVAQQCFSLVVQKLEIINSRLQSEVARARARALRTIKPLPRRADPNSTTLKLSFSLSHLLAIITDVTTRKPGQQPRLQERHRKMMRQDRWTHELAKAETVDEYLDLAEFEENLCEVGRDGKLLASEGECVKILEAMRSYYSAAKVAYNANPEQISRMLLVLVELWQAIDAYSVNSLPLLAEYEPGLPQGYLHVLQLASLGDMKRLHEIEKYLRKRTETAGKYLPSIFGDFTCESFKVRHFDPTFSLQARFEEISAISERQRRVKEVEWQQKSDNFDSNSKEIAQLSCADENGHDRKRCRRCFLGRVNRRAFVSVHEALIPSDEIQAKVLVFELHIPKAFAVWRDATWLILELGKATRKVDVGFKAPLQDVPGIKDLARVPNPWQAIALVSSTKSFKSSHYKDVKLPVTFESICLPHGARYHLIDSNTSAWTRDMLSQRHSLADMCKFHLPLNSNYLAVHSHVHPTFEGGEVTSNMVIASQTDCPDTLSITEYLAFKDLRIGGEIQWINLV